MGFLDVGPLELIVIGIVSLLVFGPDRLPEVLGKVGGYVRQFRSMADSVTREFQRELNLEDAVKPTYNYTPPIAPPPTYTLPSTTESTPDAATLSESTSENSILPPADTGITTYADQPMVELRAGMPDSEMPEPIVAPDAEVWAEQDGPVAYQPDSANQVLPVSAGEPDFERAVYHSTPAAAPASVEPTQDTVEPVAYQAVPSAEAPAVLEPAQAPSGVDSPASPAPEPPIWRTSVAFDPYLMGDPAPDNAEDEPDAEAVAADASIKPKESGHSS